MPELKCGVITCTHNYENYCELDKIEVVGNTAKQARDTSCGSFEERRSESCGNASKQVSATSHINCQAQQCKYNEGCKCCAGKISVMGTNASKIEQTECATFDA